MHPEEQYAEPALRAGAMGFVPKRKATREVVEAIRTILDGKIYLCDGSANELLKQIVQGENKPLPTLVDSLSEREFQAFKLMGQGLTTKQIADEMEVSPKTIETYRARIKTKLHIDNISALTQRATQWVLRST
jgi:DNA-binding NarL/FixJ family response regulator